MFTLDDDFDDVDEDFLSCAFETTTSKSSTNKVHNDCPENGTHRISKAFQNLQNIQPLVSNTETRKQHGEKNAEFLELWKSNENNLFNVANSPNKTDPRSKIDISRAISPRGYKTEVFTRATKNVRSRKFPGPAGLLPERNSSTSFIVPDEYLSNLEKDSEDFSEFQEEEVLSQTTNNLFEEPEGPWQKMVTDLGQLGKHLISTINLTTLQGKQTRNGFKVPFLAVFVQCIDCSLPDPSVLLKDGKEEINGTLHRDVWEEWKEEIVIGSVLVLRNVGVISAGNSSRRYFLNITANNIVTIYSPTQDSSIKTIKINTSSNMDASLILHEWEKLLKQNRHTPSVISESEAPNRPLFTTFSPGLGHSSPMVSKPLPVKPQFINRSRGRPSPIPISRSTAVPRYTNMPSVSHSKFPTHMANQSSLRFCSPSSSVLKQDTVTPSPLLKKPRIVEPNQNQLQTPQLRNMVQPHSSKSIFNISDSSGSIVESVLDGIDTDSLFEDF